MKAMRGLLIGVVCVAAVLSCDSYDGVTIVNGSTQTVSFEYAEGVHTLSPGETKIFEVAWYTPAPVNIKKVGGGTVIVEMTGHYQFTDADPIALFVVNNSSRNVILEAEDYIDAGGDGTTTTITLGPGERTTDSSYLPYNTVHIYTKRPNFKVKLDTPDVYINLSVKYNYFHGGTAETESGATVVVLPSMSVVIGP
ncbi:MAG: hypothetical protein LBS06_01410 [Treponema sp.]|jgi:hypothetical protein|nr:hypothetical protein [Treponema sp.]